MALLQDYKKLFEYTDNIKKIYLNNSVVWPTGISSTPPGPDYTEPFYVENISNENETLNIVKGRDYSPTLTIEYSTDRTVWQTFGTTSTTALTRTLAPGDKVYLRCNTDVWGTSSFNVHNAISGVSKVGGNIMSLLYGDSFTGQERSFPSNSSYNFAYIFIANYPNFDKLISASELLLPANVLTQGCYYFMFSDNTSLTSAPELPANTLARDCYTAMFQSCTSLNNVTCLATSGINTNDSTYEWLSYVSSTGTFTKAAGVTWPTGDSGIPSGWTVVEV